MIKTMPVAFFLATGILFSLPAFSQQISWSNPSGLTVCDSAFFEIEIFNDTSEPIDTGQLLLSLANCLEYLPGSASGAEEVSISNPQQLHFLIPAISPDQTVSVHLGVFAPCPCYDTLNTGTVFSNQIQFLAGTDTLTLNSPPFAVETAQLVITQIANTVLTGSKGDQFTRTFTVLNTRPGALSSFLFEDYHQGGFDISSNQGIIEVNQPGHFALRLNGNDFQFTGDGDMLFEQGESITITETITITSCGYSPPSSLSNISISWGCENQSCQSVHQTALVQFQPSTLAAVLQVIPTIEAPVCLCADGGVPQKLSIVNLGDEPAFALSFSIKQDLPGTGIDPSSAAALLNGSPVALNVQSANPITFQAPCFNGGPFQENLYINCPDLEPGDTLVLQWDSYFCDPGCAQSQNAWNYEYQFEKSCPANAVVHSDNFPVQLQHPVFGAQLSGDFFFENGETHTYTYTVQYDSLAQLAGQLAINMTVPCGLVWENSPLILDGVPPSSLSISTQDSLQFISALYPLPLPDSSAALIFDLTFFCDSLCQQEFICADSTVTSCPQFNCAELPGPTLPFEIQSTLLTCTGQPADCGLQACESIYMGFSCEPDSICFDTIAGYVFYGMEFQRISLGLPDNDNDRWPDGLAFLDPSLLRLDRSMPGDTVQTVWSGTVHIDQPGGPFSYAGASLSFQPSGVDPDINPGLYSPDGIVPLDAKLEIWDISTGQYFACENLVQTAETTTDRLIFHYAINPADLLAVGCILPPNFAFEQGDSIRLTALHRLDANPVKQVSTAPLPPIFTLTVRPELSIGQTPGSVADHPFDCGCNSANWEITGYEYQLLPGVYALPFCDTSNYQGSTYFELELGKGNFFPYEYRPLGYVPTLAITLPPEVQLAESQVKQFALQNGPIWKGITPLPGIASGNDWTFDLAPCQDTLADEGFSFLFQYRFTADCSAEGALPLGTDALVDFEPGLATPSDTVWVVATENALKPLFPNMKLFNPLPAQLALDNKARWNFTLSNQPNSVSGQQSGKIYNAWLAPISATGLLSDFVLVDTQSGTFFPEINGIFQLDSLNVNQSRQLQLIALNKSCLEETLEVRYGFGCDPYLSLDQEACKSATQYWQALAPPGGVDLYLSSPTDTCALLCDTVPYHTITLYNTNLGPVCNPYVEAILPQGLWILPGSSQLAYPHGAPFVPVADPLDMGNGVFRWNLSDLSPELAANCLPGLGTAPQHQVSLRFWSETDCSYPINTPILFRASGQRNCGDPVNTVTRLADPICIQLEGADIQTYFQAGLEDVITCQDTGLFNLALVHGSVSNSTDTVSLLLPPGVSYLSGSLIPVTNPPAGEPVLDTINNRIQLSWGLPAGLNPFTLIAFQFELSGFSGLPCGEEYFLASAGIQSEAVCAATGDTCSVRVETGTEYLPFQIERPILTIESFQVQWQPGDTLVATLTIANGTAIPAENVVVGIFLDQDGDGLGDSLLVETLLPEVTLLDSISFVFPGGVEQACQLQAVLDSTQQCLCGYDIHPVDQPIEYFQPIEVSGCSGQPVELGLCLPGWTAGWADENISCDTCCSTQFLAFNPGDSLQFYTLAQQLANGQGCLLHIPYELQIRPEPGIAYVDPAVCAGDTVNLIADPGVAFHWEGPGVDLQQQGIAIYPTATATYFLTMEDIYGCPGVDSALVTVFPLPKADAGADTIFCPGAIFQLQAFQGNNLQYAWSPAAAFVDAGAPDPVFSNPVNGVYILEVSDEKGCVNADTIEVGFGETPTLQLIADTLICAGDSLWLQASGNYSSLQWAPAAAADCLNPPLCDSILVAPLETILLTATAINADQCTAEASLIVAVANESAFALDTIFTCANEPVWIGDLFTAESGLYCDTLALPSGCLQIHCTELLVGDTISQQLAETICPGDSVAVGGQWFALPGTYPVMLSTTAGCDSTLVLDLEWWKIPVYTLLPTDTTIFESFSVELTLNGMGASFLWSPPDGLDCDTCATVLATPLESTVYQVFITDENGCVQTLESAITVRVDCDPGRVQIPTAFTPDGDGLNDSFGVLTVAGREKVLEMQVWNRWGQMVFESTDPQARWKGDHSGKPAPSDVYAYRVMVGCADGAFMVYTGEVSLLR